MLRKSISSEEVLPRIKILSGKTIAEVRGEIAILVPYRSQVDHVTMVLERNGTYMKNGVSRKGFEIIIYSVDSM